MATCVLCESGDNTTPIAIFGGLLGLGAVALAFYSQGFRLPDWLLKLPPLNVLLFIKKGMVKVVVVTYQVRRYCLCTLKCLQGLTRTLLLAQIISSVPWSLQIVFPQSFRAMLTVMRRESSTAIAQPLTVALLSLFA